MWNVIFMHQIFMGYLVKKLFDTISICNKKLISIPYMQDSVSHFARYCRKPHEIPIFINNINTQQNSLILYVHRCTSERQAMGSPAIIKTLSLISQFSFWFCVFLHFFCLMFIIIKAYFFNYCSFYLP